MRRNFIVVRHDAAPGGDQPTARSAKRSRIFLI
jgi:hypothetical protein